MAGPITKIRRIVARLPRGTLSLLVATCMLLAAVGIAWAGNAPDARVPQPIQRQAVGAALIGRTAPSPLVVSVGLTSCEPAGLDAPTSTEPARDDAPNAVRWRLEAMK